MIERDSRKVIGEYIYVSKYSQNNNGKKEKWGESIARVMNMHKNFYAGKVKDEDKEEFEGLLNKAWKMYEGKKVLGAQRAFQYGGELMLEKQARLYNCTMTLIDRVEVFRELMYLLLCGCGTGYSVQSRHTTKLPIPRGFNKSERREFIIPDTIEGWADAAGVLIENYYYGGPIVEFNYNEIRPKGAPIRGGFLAPGHEPLKEALDKIYKILSGISGRRLTPFELHYVICILANSVVTGGVRRSAMISIFDVDDSEMLTCKTGNWFVDKPELCRSNNSAVIFPDTPKEKYDKIFESTRQFGEPGFVFLNNPDYVVNPCCFTGDTLIYVNDERGVVSIKELAESGEEFLVHSARFGQTNWINEVKKAKAFPTGIKKTVKVTLSNGDSIVCTPDHRLALFAKNDYVEAKDSIGELIENLSSEILEVISVEDYSEEIVYDLTVEDNHNFYIKTSGGNYFNNYDCEGVLVHNCEVTTLPIFTDENGEQHTGFGFCNLTEINGGAIKTEEDFYKACEAAAILGTLQAGYTNFNVLTEYSKKIAERDGLIGVGITGLCENPDILFNPEIQKKGAEIVKVTNKRVAKIIGINYAARCTVIKPSGNSSQLLGTLSGITPGHSRHYIRHIQAADTEQALHKWEEVNPFMVEKSFWNPEREKVLAFPVTIPEGSIMRNNLSAVDFLRLVLLTKNNWIEYGTDMSHTSQQATPDIRMNVSNTCTVHDNEWEDVKEFIWENRDKFGGISLLSASGDLDYPQAPFTEVLDENELAERYGAGAILSSGLIVDGMNVFNDIWEACNTALGYSPKLLELTNEEIGEYVAKNIKDGHFLMNIDGVHFSDVNCVIDHLKEKVEKRLDWVRRFNSFADKYMGGDKYKTACCLKHVNNFHKWNHICKFSEVNYDDIQWKTVKKEAGSEIGAVCAGGQCEFIPRPKKNK